MGAARGRAARTPTSRTEPNTGLRRILAAAGALALILVVVLLWPIGLLTGDDDNGSQASSGGDSQQAGDQQGAISTQTQGTAIIAEQQGKTQVVVSATGLEPSTDRTAYQVWLYNSEEDRKSLGASVTDQQGNLQSVGELPADYQSYKFVDMTSVNVTGQGEDQGFERGPSVLRGLLEMRKKPVTRGKGEQRTTLLANIRLLPVPQSGG